MIVKTTTSVIEEEKPRFGDLQNEDAYLVRAFSHRFGEQQPQIAPKDRPRCLLAVSAPTTEIVQGAKISQRSHRPQKQSNVVQVQSGETSQKIPQRFNLFVLKIHYSREFFSSHHQQPTFSSSTPSPQKKPKPSPLRRK